MTCPDCEKLQRRVERLEQALAERDKKIAAQGKKIEELERRLALYDNANTPPSQLRYPTQHDGGQRTGKRFSGAPKGHPGTTRPIPKPDVVVKPEWKNCPRCGSRLGKPSSVKSRIVEEIPEPQPVVVKEFLEFEGDCRKCGAHVVARHPDCPPEGRFGKTTLVQTTLLKFEERLPHEKIRDVLERQHGLSVATASIFDFTRRVSGWLKPEYAEVLRKVRRARVVYVDETGEKVDGKRYWLWIFVTDTETLVVVRKSRGIRVLKEVLGKDFWGIIVCDGWKSYVVFTRRLQRCWAHLLREADWLAEHVEEAKSLQMALHALYGDLKAALEDDPPPEERARLARNAGRRLRYLLNKRYRSDETRKLVKKIRNGARYWFTFVTTPGVEPTNNRAERALREHVVKRKIIGTFRNQKGTSIYETTTTMLATWEQRGLNTSEMLGESLTNAWAGS